MEMEEQTPFFGGVPASFSLPTPSRWLRVPYSGAEPSVSPENSLVPAAPCGVTRQVACLPTHVGISRRDPLRATC